MTSNPVQPDLPDDALTLSGGGRMPLLGFGTWQIDDADATDASLAALEAGYRHIDTATGYGNEAGIGQALAQAALPRSPSSSPPRCRPTTSAGSAGRWRRA